MDTLTIYLDGVPGAKQRPQFARHSSGVRTFSRPKTIAYEARLKAEGKRIWNFEPLTCPIRLTITAVFPVAVSWPKWRRVLASLGKLWHVGKPDLDNVIKIACDGLNDVIWHDDAQVCWIEAKKFYGDTPGLWLSIATLDDTGLGGGDADIAGASEGDPSLADPA